MQQQEKAFDVEQTAACFWYVKQKTVSEGRNVETRFSLECIIADLQQIQTYWRIRISQRSAQMSRRKATSQLPKNLTIEYLFGTWFLKSLCGRHLKTLFCNQGNFNLNINFVVQYNPCTIVLYLFEIELFLFCSLQRAIPVRHTF